MSKQGFVLFSMPRTGSSMVVSRLSSHPDIVCLPGLLGSRGWFDWNARARRKRVDEVTARMATLPDKWNDLDRRIADLDELSDELLDLFADKKAVGFKHHLGPIHRETTVRTIGLNWRAVILTRRNALASYSSGRIVRLTGQGGLSIGQEPVRAKAEFVDLDFHNYMRWIEALYAHWTEEIDRTGVPHLTIDYCEARTHEGTERIARFLELDPALLGDGKTAKRNSDNIVSRFSNPEDAEAFLRKHDLMHWATEA